MKQLISYIAGTPGGTSATNTSLHGSTTSAGAAEDMEESKYALEPDPADSGPESVLEDNINEAQGM